MTQTGTNQPTVTDPTLKRSGGADVLALAFGTTVAMWTVGYVGRLPAVTAPASLIAMVMLVVLLTGGFLTGRLTGRGWSGGAVVGFIVAALNLLIVGSVLHGEFNAMLWVPGTLIAVTAVTAVAAAAGAVFSRAGRDDNWSGRFAAVAAVATVLLLAAGGLVTGREAGLAVPDWPASYGYNMFLYPLARMTGNIYYEHAHRLYGALVGLTTIALAVHIWISDRRGWLKFLAAVAVLAVIGQGVMGGLRVSLAASASGGTGIEVAQAEHETEISTILRVAHGVFGQMFFALMVFIAAACGRTWRRSASAQAHEGAAVDRALGVMLVAAMLLQLLLGAMVRHLQHDVLLHVSMAAVVTLLALVGAMRAWGMHGERLPVLKRVGIVTLVVLALQLVLGVTALIILGMSPPQTSTPTAADVIVTTAHQFNGAALLALAVLLAAFNFRLLRPATALSTNPRPAANAAELQSG